MKKQEKLLFIKETLGLKTKKEAEEFVAQFDAIVEALAKLNEGAKIELGGIKLEVVAVEAKSGTMKRKDVVTGEMVETNWSTPAHKELKVSVAKSLKRL